MMVHLLYFVEFLVRFDLGLTIQDMAGRPDVTWIDMI